MNSVSSSSSLAKTNFLILIGAETRKSTVLLLCLGCQRPGIIELIRAKSSVSTDIVNDIIQASVLTTVRNRTSVEYLLGNGHGRWGWWRARNLRPYGKADRFPARSREKSPLPEEYLIVSEGFGYTSGFNAARKLLGSLTVKTRRPARRQRRHFPSASSAASESVGFRVPEDISVIGFDDISTSRLFTPALTTIRQNKRDWGDRRENPD